MAASSIVSQSEADPARYYRNNVRNTINLLETMCNNGVTTLLLSSTAAANDPCNVYGITKLICEDTIKAYAKSEGINYTIFRYYNVAGHTMWAKELHVPETHLIPLALKSAKTGQPLHIYGTDYNTADGTALRDYIHVQDIVDAHMLALKSENKTYHLGNNKAYSVKEVINCVEKHTGNRINIIESPRRAGDPGFLFSSSHAAKRELGWEPKYNLDAIIQSML
jgi:UDP-glucose 4-epimerase